MHILPSRLLAPQDLKVGSNACSPRTSSLLLSLLLSLHRHSREVRREKEEREAAWLLGDRSSRSGWASNKRRSGRDGIVDPAPGFPGESTAPGI